MTIRYFRARWAANWPRPDDIVIWTFAKRGTPWMQRIVSMLIAGGTAPAGGAQAGGSRFSADAGRL